jgi:ribose 5-phosphate isomerase B
VQPIALGADEAGAPLKEHLAKYLKDNGYDVKDYGNGTDEDYPDVAARVAEAVSAGEHGRALLVCGTGLAGVRVPGRRIHREGREDE